VLTEYIALEDRRGRGRERERERERNMGCEELYSLDSKVGQIEAHAAKNFHHVMIPTHSTLNPGTLLPSLILTTDRAEAYTIT
jgi:hypothetical protein